MSEELLELVKAHTNCAQTPNLSTRANANILAVQIADLITRNLQDKQKLNTFINYIRNLSHLHNRKQCISVDNVSVYLNHLPIATTNQEDEDLHLPKADINQEINSFYRQQAQKQTEVNKIKEYINIQTQQSLPPDFDYNVIISDTNTNVFELNLNNDINSPILDSCNDKQRESAVKLAMSVCNLPSHENLAKTAVNNLVAKLSKYEELLICEREFLKWLLTERYLEARRLVELFPFLLEEHLIDIAIKHLQGKLEGRDYQQLDWVQKDVEIKNQGMDIIHSLFVMAKYDLNLLDVLKNIIQ
ncbi:uncharacterized protein [Atheta coriaria]|uniref:uncharacterized protein n=1 Tax=Dalotia coriaria TaxID=877792 RepID=UPI0031F3B184